MFRFNGTSWVREQKLTASDGAPNDEFGRFLSLSGDTVVVGAWQDDCAAGVDCGSAYVFRFNGASWIEEQKLTVPGAAEGNHFGQSVSLSGDTVVIGEPSRDCGAGVRCGAAYVFRFDGASWVQVQELTFDAALDGGFGISVSLSGSTIVVGAFARDCAAGFGCRSAYVFRFNGTSWVRERRLAASDTTAFNLLGHAVSVSGDTVIVGTAETDCAAGHRCGSAFMFDLRLTCPSCANGRLDPREKCDGGLGCTNCSCDPGFEPTVPPSVDCQPICGNGTLDIGEACDGLTDAACPGACQSDCTCGPFCGDGSCGSDEDQCSCAADCGPPSSSESLASTCDDGLDNDCDGLTDSDDPDCAAIPTVSHWGMIFVTLMLLASAKIAFRRTGGLSGSVGRLI